MNTLLIIIFTLSAVVAILCFLIDERNRRKHYRRTDKNIKRPEILKSDKYKTYFDDEYRNVVRLNQWRWKKRIKK